MPTNTRLSREGLVTSMELGMWRLFSNEQQQETFTLLDWDELPKEARLDFFHSLPKDDKSRIYTLPDPQTREQATRAMFCKLLNKPESGKGTAPPSISPLPSKVQPDAGTRQPGKSP